ncbi:unnamed protein product [Mytilus coruscus]|uniref:Uncharacterized protein n=1 Tax=Mytilus coruscus TaxID=42192 RepID=A0A6J8BHQ2_MYTCO|nr:unnamed protein product [Mytilus coruscus]
MTDINDSTINDITDINDSAINDMTFRKSKHLYTCFVDLRKAFDTINRDGLFHKLLKYNIKGSFFNILKDMYKDVSRILTYIDTSSDNITFIIYCFLLRIILAIGCCGLQTAGFALVAKEIPDSVATIYHQGITEVFLGVGFMSGPAIGGFLYGSGGFIMPFAVIGAIMFLCVPFNFWLIPAYTVVEKSSSSKISFWEMMKSPQTIINSFSTLVAAMIFSIVDPTLEPHLSGSLNLEADIIGLLFLLMAAFYAIMSPIAGWICDKLPDNRGVLIPGFIISAVGMLFLGPSEILGLRDLFDDQLWLNIVSLIVLGIGSSLALVPTFDIYVSIAEELGFGDDLGMYDIVAGLWGSFYDTGFPCYYFHGCIIRDVVDSITGLLYHNYRFSYCHFHSCMIRDVVDKIP